LVVTGNSKTLTARAILNNTTFYENIINTDATIQKNNSNFYMSIPNWLLVKGDRLTPYFNSTVGAGHTESIIIMGYYV